NVVLCQIAIHDAAGSDVDDGALMQCERHAPDHAAVILAAHQPGVDDPPGRERAHEARHPDLAEIGVDLDLCEDRAMRMHGVSLLCGRVRHAPAPPLHLGKPCTGQNVGIALAAAFVTAAV